MPSSGIAKTKSARKAGANPALRLLSRAGIGLTLSAFLSFTIGALFYLPRLDTRPTYTLKIDAHPDLPSGHGRYGGVIVSQPWTYHLRGAMTAEQQQKGLGDTKKLQFNQGMIFVYNQAARRCFWMKDMRYSIDIIWLDEMRKVTAIEHDVSPGTYPDSFCHQARYVIELKAGEAVKAGIEQGQRLSF